MNSLLESKEFLGLWSVHARRVYAYILTLAPHANDADDIFQETSIALWEKFDQFQPGSEFGAWACRVAYFKTLSHFQKRPNVQPFDENLLHALDAEASALTDEFEAQFLALNDCLSKLNPRDRELLELRYQGDRKVDDVAQFVGRSAKSVYRSLSRIHDLLFDCIQKHVAPERSE
jgi:RNA polymerase sigma-70 factor (ECF subfamily)